MTPAGWGDRSPVGGGACPYPANGGFFVVRKRGAGTTNDGSDQEELFSEEKLPGGIKSSRIDRAVGPRTRRRSKMQIPEKASLLRIFIGEAAKPHPTPPHIAIVPQTPSRPLPHPRD